MTLEQANDRLWQMNLAVVDAKKSIPTIADRLRSNFTMKSTLHARITLRGALAAYEAAKKERDRICQATMAQDEWK